MLALTTLAFTAIRQEWLELLLSAVAVIAGTQWLALVHAARPAGRASPLAVALAWVRDRPGVVAPIVGARTSGQLKGSLDADDVTLPDEAGVELCQMAGARQLCLFHHEPIHGDESISRVLAETRRYEEISRTGKPLLVTAAYDGMEIRL